MPPDGPNSAAGTLPLGSVLGERYELQRVLGEGGMGTVYQAVHRGMNRPVAVKVLSAQMASLPELGGRFEREAIAIGRIAHPNCIHILDIGATPDGDRYLVMELLDGESLERVIARDGALPVARAIDLLMQLLSALGHIHRVGVVHRDIKAENVFLVRLGNREVVKVLDFGIAKLLTDPPDEVVTLTQAGLTFGTPIYMSPEQAIGAPADGRADLYSASVLAYEMLTGRPPFIANDRLELMAMHTSQPAPPMRERQVPGAAPIPAALEAVILRGLAKKPAQRFESADDYLSTLRHALQEPGKMLAAIDPSVRSNRTASDLAPPAVDTPHAATGERMPTQRFARAVKVLAALALVGVLLAGVHAWRTAESLSQPNEQTAELHLRLAGSMEESSPLAALDELAAARKLVPAICEDKVYRALLRQLAGSKDATASDRALHEEVACASPTQALTEALQSDNYYRRQAGLRMARTTNAEAVPWRDVYERDLVDAPDCPRRKLALEKLAALGDAAAIPAIEAVLGRKGKKAKGYQCLISTARETLTLLRAGDSPSSPSLSP